MFKGKKKAPTGSAEAKSNGDARRRNKKKHGANKGPAFNAADGFEFRQGADHSLP